MLPLLSIAVFLPLLGALLLMILPDKTRRIAHTISIGFTGLTFLVTLAIWSRGIVPGGFAQVEEVSWIPAVGAAYRLGIDGLSRFARQMTPEAFRTAGLVILAFGVFSAIYGAFVALAQTDLKS